ncbi:MAG: tetratricopeptide repeat protein [Bacteroidota bacterium]
MKYLYSIILLTLSVSSFAQSSDKAAFNSQSNITIEKHIENNMRYPMIAYCNGVQGYIHISFRLNQEGEIIETKLERRVYELMDLEAIRLVKSTEGMWVLEQANSQHESDKVVVKVKFKLDEHPEAKKLLKSYKKADKYLKKGKYKEAAALFNLILENNPFDYDVQYKLAQCYFNMNMKTEACKLLEDNKYSKAVKLKETKCK